MVPLRHGRRYASSTNPRTWRHYEEALAAYETNDRLVGVGRVIVEGDGLVGVDIDDERNPETGELSAWASDVLELLDSYSEVSPSRTGVKVWVLADLTRAHVKDGLEVYSGRRYFSVTGQILPQFSAEIEERTDQLQELVKREFPEPPPHKPETHHKRAEGEPLDLGAFLEEVGVQILGTVTDGSAALKFTVLCPWMDEHTKSPRTGTVVGQYLDGGTFFKCWHAHCSARTWRDFRRTVLRPKRVSDFVEVNVTYGR